MSIANLPPFGGGDITFEDITCNSLTATGGVGADIVETNAIIIGEDPLVAQYLMQTTIGGELAIQSSSIVGAGYSFTIKTGATTQVKPLALSTTGIQVVGKVTQTQPVSLIDFSFDDNIPYNASFLLYSLTGKGVYIISSTFAVTPDTGGDTFTDVYMTGLYANPASAISQQFIAYDVTGTPEDAYFNGAFSQVVNIINNTQSYEIRIQVNSLAVGNTFSFVNGLSSLSIFQIG